MHHTLDAADVRAPDFGGVDGTFWPPGTTRAQAEAELLEAVAVLRADGVRRRSTGGGGRGL